MSKHDALNQPDHFDEALKYHSTEARWYILDSLACMFHNEGYSLEGNTEANDARWLARNIWINERHHVPAPSQFDNLPEHEQKRYLDIAEIAIKALPALAERMAARYITISQALRTTEKVAREQASKMRDQRRRQRESRS